MEESTQHRRRVTGPEHYREAERLIAEGVYDEDGDELMLVRDVALAQVHATLALAAATAAMGDLRAWRQIAGIDEQDEGGAS